MGFATLWLLIQALITRTITAAEAEAAITCWPLAVVPAVRSFAQAL